MKPAFSEFSYGFALTRELISRHTTYPVEAPTFPSLYQEGKQGGYDVKITYGYPLFLQFKLSHFLSSATAKEFTRFNQPYYRMLLRKRTESGQHEMLMELESDRQHFVFYACPMFHSLATLNTAFLRDEVADRSAFFSPRNIGPLPDNKQHYIAFTDNACYFCSDNPREISRHSFQDIQRELRFDDLSRRKAPVDNNFYAGIIQAILSAARKASPRNPDILMLSLEQETNNLAQQAAFLSRLLLDCELLIMT